ncbi:hypothetical protein WDJ51_06905 [Rathayibacter sp. YIM 133350]|uniref:hypothetical protein n=1 Tax=Rathayibacter sp. YIM 133350 TaxID=3131992 RepID=UPI00307DC87E
MSADRPQSPAGLSPAVREAIARGVQAMPERLTAHEAARAVRQLAIISTNPEAAASLPVVLRTAREAEGERGPVESDAAKPSVSRAYSWWSVIAFTLALIAPALVLAGLVSSSAPDPVAMALASGVAMAIALGLFVWLEPLRTSSPFYRGGNFAGGLFVFYAVLWAIAALVVLGRFDELQGNGGAVAGLVLQVLAAIGCGVLSVFAIRHDRRRPRWTRVGESVHPTTDAGTDASDADLGVQGRLDDWRRHVWNVSSAAERAAVRAAESEALRLQLERGQLTGEQVRATEQLLQGAAEPR